MAASARAAAFASALASLAACWQSGGDSAAPGLPSVPPAPPSLDTPTGAPAIARVPPPVDVVSTSGALAAWPRLLPGVTARSISSFDRAGGNDDGFGGTWSRLYDDPDTGEPVIFDAAGPGVLRTMWFTSGTGPDEPLGLGKVRFRFDGEKVARIEIDGEALFRGEGAPFERPLVQDSKLSTGGHVSWVALPFRTRLVITTQNRPQFYAMHYEELPPDWDIASFQTGDRDAALVKSFTETGLSPLPLEDVPLDVRRAGAGTIDVLRFEPSGAPTDEEIRGARVRAWFDAAADPQIDVPLGAFFGSGLGQTSVRAVAWTMQPGAWESRLPMPFWESFHLEVTGLAGRLRVHVGPSRFARGEAGWLFGKERRATPVTPGQDFVYLDETGAGKVVATVLTVTPQSPAAKKWWEGDMRSFVDDLRARSIHGTGHEDDHLGGWSNEFLTRPFTLPMQGCPRADVIDPDPKVQINANATMYRLWPGIPFSSRIRHSTEHGYTDAVGYGAATFYYRVPSDRLERSDAFDVADGTAAGAHALRGEAVGAEALTSAFDGAPGTTLTATAIAYATPFSFEVAIRPENAGVALRRLYDGRNAEAARVVVDGVDVGAMLHAEPAPIMRWAERDFFVPPSVTRGKSRLTVRIVPLSARITAARFEARIVRP